MKINELTPVFVNTIPSVLEDGKIYIRKDTCQSSHKCACGCGMETILAFKPIWDKEYVLTENDGKITFRPSVGNFKGERPYHANYYITNNKIEWL